ncbi:MAG TPA: hypothetical protein VIV06_10355, partial [Candidatus Limnocylindrales bacterium]
MIDLPARRRPPRSHSGLRVAATIVVALAVAAIALGVAAASGTVPAGSPPGLETGLAGATASSARAVASAPASSPILFASPTATSAADAPASPEPSGTASPAGAASLPAASAVPGGPATPQLDPPPSPGPFEIDLYAKGDFVSELTKEMCVPAAIQTMANIMGSETDRSGRTQRRLYARARALSPPTLVGPGAEPAGWAATLDELGFGPYRVDVEPTRGSAIAAAAKALRMTGRPVGLLVWRGAHSWVVSGFQATTDPA